MRIFRLFWKSRHIATYTTRRFDRYPYRWRLWRSDEFSLQPPRPDQRRLFRSAVNPEHKGYTSINWKQPIFGRVPGCLFFKKNQIPFYARVPIFPSFLPGSGCTLQVLLRPGFPLPSFTQLFTPEYKQAREIRIIPLGASSRLYRRELLADTICAALRAGLLCE